MKKDEIKNKLAETCMMLIHDRIALLQMSMKEAQSSANAHKGAMESRYDTFKEEAQYLAGGYAKQINDAKKDLVNAKNISLITNEFISIGSVVVTNELCVNENISKRIRYFIYLSVNSTNIAIGGNEYICISHNAPIANSLFGKQEGDEITFRGRTIEIVEVF